MPTAFPLDIVTPERTVLSELVLSVRLPSVNGSMGILAHHAPLLAELGVGECVVKLPSGAEELYAISGGFVEVSREKVTVIADSAENASEIDVNRAEAALSRARALLASTDGMSPEERADAARTLRRAQTRIKIARGGVS